MVLRRARGYAPFPVTITAPAHPPILAVGAHLKNSVALGVGSQIIIGQHIGDLETPEAQAAFQDSIRDLARLHQVTPQIITADAHPDYVSSRHARELAGDQPPVLIQHHLAHVLACLAENELTGSVLGVSWDGTGYGLDQTVWGGEFFRVTDTQWERVAHLRPFPLPGGEAAVREARRSALGLLLTQWPEAWQSRLPENLFTPGELRVLPRMISQRINSPLTSSMGRLFDAVASLTGRAHLSRFEGEAAMSLEFALDETAPEAGAYPFPLDLSRQPWRLDWAPMLEHLLQDVHAGTGIATISARFHNGLAEAIVAVARQTGESRIVLGGGCFQNRYLVERTIEIATRTGLRVYWPQRVPPNDGGICVGQVVAVLRNLTPG
jgi:hydrogenase maturation protein HypF